MVRTTRARVSDLSDEELMRRVQTDDTHAFDELYGRYHARAFNCARHICDTTEGAEEAVQEAFLCLWTTRGGYDENRGNAHTWLFALLRHRSIDISRKHRREALHVSDAHLETVPALGSVEDGAVAHDEGDHLRASLQHLPVLQREVIVLAYFGGLTQSEIAARLALPMGTVKGRMRLGLNKARSEIDNRGQ